MERKQLIDEDSLRLMFFQSAGPMADAIDQKLVERYGFDKEKYTFRLRMNENFFEDGHLKVELLDSVRGRDIFTLTDIGNYSITYNMHGFENHASPNDLMMQLKDGISACNRHTHSINIIMPLLYNGRQHRRNTMESLSCGANLHEIDMMKGIQSFVTFDAHDQGVEHSVFNIEFNNFIPSNIILNQLIDNLSCDDLKKMVFVAPDNGASGRRSIYLNSFNSTNIDRQAGSFIKRRDYNHVVFGINPIISHDYSGIKDLDGYTALVVDDMISSGGSMFDVVDKLSEMNVSKVFIIATYCLFTRGIDQFEKYYQEGKLSGIYTTNLSYIPEEYKQNEWLHVCDCSDLISDIIYNIHNNKSLSGLLRDRSQITRKLERKFQEEK